MAYQAKTWKNRAGTGLNKYKDSVSGNTLELTNTPDSVTEAGDAFSAANMNDLEQRIDDAIRVTWNTANLKIVTSLPAAPETGVIYLLKE